MRIRIDPPQRWPRGPAVRGSQTLSQRLQVGVLSHQPLRALAVETHLHACVRAVTFDVQDDALSEFPVPHTGSQSHARDRRLFRTETADGDGSCDLDTWTNFFNELFRNLFDESRRNAVAVNAVESSLFGIR